MSKKSSKRKTNVKSSLLVLLLIAILLIASTYAWFTANRVVAVSELQVNVGAQNGLQISTDAVNWKAEINNTDITTGYSGDTNQLPTAMAPVSTAGTVAADGTMEMFFGTVVKANDDGSWALTATKEKDTKGTTGNYIAFDLFLKADTAMDITLTGNSNVKFAGTEGTSKGLENAARVAFIKEGNVASTNSSGALTLKGGKTFTDGNADTIIWEPNCGSHTAEAAAGANSTYYGGNETVQAGTDQEAIPYWGTLAAIDSGNAQKLSTVNTGTPNATYFKKVEGSGLKSTQVASNEVANILHLEAGITKVRVYMWVEGQDADCDNSASGTDIAFNIEFSAPDTVGT